MTDYDFWLLQGPGGPYDEPEPDPHEQASEEFHELPPRLRFKVRRMAKRSTARRRQNRAWARRQRREDINAQVIY
jgi:hypothetical protein